MAMGVVTEPMPSSDPIDTAVFEAPAEGLLMETTVEAAEDEAVPFTLAETAGEEVTPSSLVRTVEETIPSTLAKTAEEVAPLTPEETTEEAAPLTLVQGRTEEASTSSTRAEDLSGKENVEIAKGVVGVDEMPAAIKGVVSQNNRDEDVRDAPSTLVPPGPMVLPQLQ